jgi:hypothetical protein
MATRKIVLLIITIILVSFSISAQEAQKIEDLERRVKELETRLAEAQAATPSPELAELQRQIEILTREIEALRVERQRAPQADASQYGFGAAASKVYRAEQGVSLGGYGEMLYENYDGTRDDEARSGRKDQLDFLRAILYAGYKFNDRVLFNSEIEFEHATTGGSVGEVSVEFAYLDFFINPAVNARAGLLLVPMGIINELHEPTTFLGARRPQVEQQIIPSTWRENGAGVFGDLGPISYRAYLVTGFDAEDFSSTGWRSGRQQGGRAKAEDFAGVARIDWRPFEGTAFGASYYSGDSAQDKVAPGFGEFDANVTLTEAHVDSNVRGIRARALWTEGRLGDARLVNLTNNLTGRNSVGEKVGGWYGELGYDLGAAFDLGDDSVVPYARYERFNTQKEVPSGYSLNPERDQTISTLGIAWLPHPQVILKGDYQNVDNEGGTGVDQINVAIGYIF